MSAGGEQPNRVFGFWTCFAFVVGNMIGSGFYLLPATLAPFGWNAVFGWMVTILGALSLAAVFGCLARSFPQAGGPYVFPKQAFGRFPAFLVAWSYYLSLPIGNAAIATGVVAPLATLSPFVARWPAAIALGVVWLVTAFNCIDARLVGRVQLATTMIKFLPLAAVVLLAGYALGGGANLPPLRAEAVHLGGATGIASAAAVTLWAFLGLESATIPAEKVSDAGRTIFRATIAGTLATGLVYLLASSAVTLLMPQQQLAHSGAPLADFVRPYWGGAAGTIIALAAALSSFGALNGWILLQGEMPWAMARDGVFPRWLAQSSPRGTPVRAHILSSILLTIVVILNYSRSLVELFTFLILLATLASLLPYLVCSLAALRLKTAGRMHAGPWLLPVAAIATVYSGWATWGTGTQSLLWGAALLAAGVPVYFLSRIPAAPGLAAGE